MCLMMIKWFCYFFDIKKIKTKKKLVINFIIKCAIRDDALNAAAVVVVAVVLVLVVF